MRLPDDGAPHRDPLPLTPRERARLALEEGLEVEDMRGVLDASVDLVLGDLLDAEPEGDVLVDGEVGVQRVALEDHRDVAVARRHVVDHAVADPQHAARDVLETGNHPERRRLAAPGRSDEHHELTVGDLQVEPRYRLRPVGVDLANSLERDCGHRTIL